MRPPTKFQAEPGNVFASASSSVCFHFQPGRYMCQELRSVFTCPPPQQGELSSTRRVGSSCFAISTREATQSRVSGRTVFRSGAAGSFERSPHCSLKSTQEKTEGWLKSRRTMPRKAVSHSCRIAASGSPQLFGTSAMTRTPSRSAQYSLRGTSTLTWVRIALSPSRRAIRISSRIASSVGQFQKPSAFQDWSSVICR